MLFMWQLEWLPPLPKTHPHAPPGGLLPHPPLPHPGLHHRLLCAALRHSHRALHKVVTRLTRD